MNAPDLSPTAYALLGMIRLGRRTGYDIKRLVDASTRFFWAASYGQIYPELRRLEERGLVEGREEPAGGRARRVYELTPAGERALTDWLRDDTREPVAERRDEGLLKLFFADALPREDALAHVRRMRERHERTLERLLEIRPSALAERDRVGHEFPLHTLEAGIAYSRSAASWCAELERRLAARAPVAEESGR